MEQKVFTSFLTKASDQGVVEAIVAVMGNVDDGGDILHPGAFSKTISERSGKIKVLDSHRTDSTSRLIGKPLEMRELGKQELPPDLLMHYPDATGGLWTKTQFLVDTPEGEGAFKRIKAGVLDEWSIGYDALDTDYSKITKDGKEITVRNLRTCKLYEYSPVLWAMNSATATLSAKGQPTEGKPYRAIEEGGTWRVYKLDEDGEPTGDALGEHETEEEAQAQVRALYANEGKADEKVTRTEAGTSYPASAYLVVEDPQEPSKWHLRVRDENGKPDHRLMGAAWAALHGGYRGNVYEGPGKQEAIAKLRAMYEAEDMPMPGKSAKVGRRMRGDKTELIRKMGELLDELRTWADYEDEPEPDKEDNPAPEEAADNKPDGKGAGPQSAPTSDILRAIEIEEEQLKLLEVSHDHISRKVRAVQ